MARDEKDTDDRVTDRLPENSGVEAESRVTDRLPPGHFEIPIRRDGDERVTDRLEPAKPEPAYAPPARAETGRVVAGHYRIEEGPIGAESGEARVFRCRDLNNGEQVALKLYKSNLSPKKEVMERLLNIDHPDLVCLRAYGRHENNFYEVLEFCRGGSIADRMPVAENELRGLLPQIMGGLRFCHDQGIVHRDLKPNNILFRDENHTQIAIGDFGISSFLDEDQGSKKTRTFMFFTIDYCPPEQLRLREVGPAADYYSLGIALIELLTGESPFKGLTDDEIVDRHLQGQVPLPETISEDFYKLLKGLLRQNPRHRWGYNQIRSWLFGEPILRDDGTPDVEEQFFGAEIKYPECDQAKNPKELARCLHLFNAAGDLFRGRISLWVKLFDPGLADRIVEIEENYTGAPDLGLFKLKYTLDPTLPLVIGSESISSLDELKKALRTGDRDLRRELKEAFIRGEIAIWIEANGDPERQMLGNRIRQFLKRHARRRELSVHQLYFLIKPKAPLYLGSGAAVRTPEELVEHVINDREVRDVVKKYLFTGQLADWLEISAPDRAKDSAFLDSIVDDYSHDRDLGLKAMIWYFNPDHPLTFEDQPVSDPRRLAELIDQGEEGRMRGITLLLNGSIRAWLLSTGMLSDPEPFDRIMSRESYSPGVKLEMILRLLDPDLPRPEVAADPEEIYVGSIVLGDMKERTLIIYNKGRGHLSGRLSVEGAGKEVTLDKYVIDGNKTIFHVYIRPLPPLAHGLVREGVIRLETNGGGLDVNFRYEVIHDFGEPDFEVEDDTPHKESRLSEFLKKFR